MATEIFSQQAIEVPPRRMKVLLVDEEANYLNTLRLTLEGQGFEVFSCPTFESGVRCLEAMPFDFVVLSQGSQAFEGRPVLDLATKLDRHRPVLVLTRCHNMRCYLEVMQMGAIDYLEKPIRPVDLLRCVQGHIAVSGNRVRGAQV
jgi:DNA-binding response OmpR family regulator